MWKSPFAPIAHVNPDTEERRKYLFVTLGLSAGLPVLLFLALFHYSSGSVTEGTLDIFLFITLAVLFVLLRTTENMKVIFRLSATILSLHFLLYAYTGGGSGFNILLALVIPFVCFYLLGKKEGLIWVTGFFVLIGIILFFPDSIGAFAYEKPFSVHYIFTFFIVSTFTYVLEDLRLEYESRLQTDISMKNDLIKEIHKRAKNNLMIVRGILTLHERYKKDADASSAIQETKNMIDSLGRVHDIFYNAPSDTVISAREYIEPLVRNLMHTYSWSNKKVKLDLRIPDSPMNMNKLVPIGLIVNELVTNALKYAFQDTNKGILTLSLTDTGKGEHTLVIRDNGPGLPEDFDLSSTRTMGLRIVSELLDQLNARLNVTPQPGAVFEITFR